MPTNLTNWPFSRRMRVREKRKYANNNKITNHLIQIFMWKIDSNFLFFPLIRSTSYLISIYCASHYVFFSKFINCSSIAIYILFGIFKFINSTIFYVRIVFELRSDEKIKFIRNLCQKSKSSPKQKKTYIQNTIYWTIFNRIIIYVYGWRCSYKILNIFSDGGIFFFRVT